MNKCFIILFLCLLFLIGTAEAQDQNLPLGVGPYFAMKGGINGGEVPTGRQNKVAFNGVPDFGATVFYPLSQTSPLGLTADLAFSTYSYKVYGFDQGNTFQLTYSYITFCPNFYFEGFTLGFNFGIPVSAGYGPKIPTSELGLLAEFRLGAILPLYTDKTGTLNFIINAGYALTGLYKDFSKDDPLITDIPPAPTQIFANNLNPRPISLMAGINYYFNLE